VTNPSILYVSLPAGTYFGSHPDHWLNQCWRLNITGLSETFTIRINNTHASFVSYDTHLIITLNNASYEYLESLTVDSTPIPKSSFIYSKPEPYGFTLTWEEDVYPAWFSDIYVVGAVDPKGYKDVEVSVMFSNATGVRMHFDAYGSQDSSPPPANKGHVTHNPHQKDSTVLFWSPPVMKYYLTVGTDPENITTIPGEGWYDDCTYVDLTAPLYVPDEAGVEGERHMFTHWTVDDNFEAGNTITVHMDANHTTIAHYVKQYYLTVISLYDTPGGMGWYNSSGTAYATLDTGMVDHGNGTRRVFTQWSGDASGMNYAESNPIIMDAPKTATANWKTQYYLTVQIDPPGITTIPGEGWYNYSETVELTAPAVAGYDFLNWDVDGDPVSGNPIQVHVNETHTATAHYEPAAPPQYLVTFDQSGVDTDNTGVVLTVDGNDYGVADLPVFFWWDEGSTHDFAFQSPLVVTPEAKRYVWASTTGLSSLQSDTITLTTDGSIVGNYKTQYYLTVRTAPSGIVTIPGEGWYDHLTSVPLTAPSVAGYNFLNWDVDGTSQGAGVASITVSMIEPHTATAHYEAVAVPVGGYSVSLTQPTEITPLIGYTMILAIFGAAITLIRRKRK